MLSNYPKYKVPDIYLKYDLGSNRVVCNMWYLLASVEPYFPALSMGGYLPISIKWPFGCTQQNILVNGCVKAGGHKSCSAGFWLEYISCKILLVGNLYVDIPGRIFRQTWHLSRGCGLFEFVNLGIWRSNSVNGVRDDKCCSTACKDSTRDWWCCWIFTLEQNDLDVVFYLRLLRIEMIMPFGAWNCRFLKTSK